MRPNSNPARGISKFGKRKRLTRRTDSVHRLKFEQLDARLLLACDVGAQLPFTGGHTSAADEMIWTLRNFELDERVLGEGSENNAELVEAEGDQSQWLIRRHRDGSTLRNLSTGRFLSSNSFEAFTTATVTDDSLWRIISHEDGTISLQNRQSGRYLDGDGAGEDWDVDESIEILDDDRWLIETGDAPTEIWTLRNREFGLRYLHEAADANAELDLSVSLRSQWLVTQGQGGVYLQSVATGNYLASSCDEGFTVNAPIQGTLWTVMENDDGSVSLKNRATGQYLDGNDSADGWDVDASDSALAGNGWFVAVQEAPEVWMIENASLENHYMVERDDFSLELDPSPGLHGQWVFTESFSSDVQLVNRFSDRMVEIIPEDNFNYCDWQLETVEEPGVSFHSWSIGIPSNDLRNFFQVNTFCYLSAGGDTGFSVDQAESSSPNGEWRFSRVDVVGSIHSRFLETQIETDSFDHGIAPLNPGTAPRLEIGKRESAQAQIIKSDGVVESENLLVVESLVPDVLARPTKQNVQSGAPVSLIASAANENSVETKFEWESELESLQMTDAAFSGEY